jgi:hypothetical protein
LCLLLKDWATGVSLVDLENECQSSPGMVENLGRQAGWLVLSAASVLKATDKQSRIPEHLQSLAFAVKNGLPNRLHILHHRLGDILYRREMLALDREEITTVDDFLEAGLDVIRGLISSENRLHEIEKRIDRIKEDTMKLCESSIAIIRPDSIEIDGTPVRERFLVRINGQPISLTGKSFKYLLRLVWSRLTHDNGWLYKEELERGFNQARYLYRLRQEIGRDFLPEWPLYENNRSGYYRLAADRRGLKVNVDALKEIPDYEIQQMAHDLDPLMAD